MPRINEGKTRRKLALNKLFSLSSMAFLLFSISASFALSLLTLFWAFLCFFAWFSSMDNSFFLVFRLSLIIFFQLIQAVQFCFTFKIAAFCILKDINLHLSSFGLLSQILHVLPFSFHFCTISPSLFPLFFSICQSLALFLDDTAVLGYYLLRTWLQGTWKYICEAFEKPAVISLENFGLTPFWAKWNNLSLYAMFAKIYWE